MKFAVSPAAQALLVAHISTAGVSLVAISLVMKTLDMDELRVWFTWTGLLVWFNATIDSGVSQCAFRRIAESNTFLTAAREMHTLVVLARALLMPIALALLVAVVAPAWQIALLPPTLVAVVGLILSASWALPMFRHPLHCVAAVTLLQLASLGAYWWAGRSESSVVLYAWVLSLTQLLVGLTYGAFLHAQTTRSSLDGVSIRTGLQLVGQSIPLSFASIITLPYSSAVPLVSGFMSSAELARLAIVERVVKAVQALQVPVSQSMLRGTFTILASDDHSAITKRLLTVLAVQVAGAIASAVMLTAFGEWFLRLWTGRDWPGVLWTIAPMTGAIICTAVTNTLSQHALIPNRRDGTVLTIVGVAGLASFVLLPLAASGGATGVAMAILGVECFVLAAYSVAYFAMNQRKAWK